MGENINTRRLLEIALCLTKLWDFVPDHREMELDDYTQLQEYMQEEGIEIPTESEIIEASETFTFLEEIDIYHEITTEYFK